MKTQRAVLGCQAAMYGDRHVSVRVEFDCAYGIPYNRVMSLQYSKKLHAERTRNGLSVRGLADLIGCDKSSIVDWEQAKREPTPIYKERLARYLGGSLRPKEFPASNEHMTLRPDHVPEEDWIQELRTIYDVQLDSMSQLSGVSDLRNVDIEERAAIVSRQIQLWAHNIVPNPFGGGVHYKLTTNADGEKEWVSNVVERPANDADCE